MKRMVKNGDLIDVEPDGSITVAGKPIGGGSSSFSIVTLLRSDLTPDSQITTRANINETKNAELDSLFEGENAFQFLRTVYADNTSYINIALESIGHSEGAKQAIYSSPSNSAKFTLTKRDEETYYFFDADGATIGEILQAIEKIEFVKLN